ncbi:MAG: YicC/YloC family endoribonuclease [Anaerovoracaceae bacterium]|jgi:uncharacterized protein (TIGR00255 family)
MIKSMTGFGRGEHTDGKRNYYVEVKSVNHRYCDITVKMPRRYAFAEDKVKGKAKETIKRGKAEIFIMVDSVTEEDAHVKANTVVAKQYMDGLNQLKDALQLEGEVTVSYVAGLPDVMKMIPDVQDEEEITAAILLALEKALEGYDAMRSMEGRKLAEDLQGRGRWLREQLKVIEKLAPEVGRSYAAKLKERIGELVAGAVEIPQDRILLEAAIFADKTNITEELIRLASHIDQLEANLEANKPVGKKLDFLMQEMNREANTIGSKANDLDITGTMLEIKSEVEKMREQVQNIE